MKDMTPQEKLAAELRAHASDCREAADLNTDVVLQFDQLAAMAEAMDSAAATLLSEQGEVTITTDASGRCVAVTRQDGEGRILSVIWEASEHGGGGEAGHAGYLVDGSYFYYADFPRSEWSKHNSVVPLYLHPPTPSAPVVDDAMVERLAQQAYEVHSTTPVGQFPNDDHWPKWRAVVRMVAAALATPAVEGGIKLRKLSDWEWIVRIGDGQIPELFDTPQSALAAALDCLGIATPEQPGSAVQGEAVAWLCENNGDTGATTLPSAVEYWRARGWKVTPLYTTPPPAPDAEQGDTCPKCGATSEDDAGSKCIPDGDSCPGVESPLAEAWAQPEARGVEAPAEDCTATEWLDFANGNSVEDIAAALATPNPVRAEQPEGKGVAELLRRIDAAIERVTSGRGQMRVPADNTDPDLVLADAGNWIKAHAAPAAPVGVDEATQDAIDSILHRLNGWAQAYPESVFGPVTDAERKEHGSLISRASASMGRHMTKMIAADLTKLTAALAGKAQEGK